MSRWTVHEISHTALSEQDGVWAVRTQVIRETRTRHRSDAEAALFEEAERLAPGAWRKDDSRIGWGRRIWRALLPGGATLTIRDKAAPIPFWCSCCQQRHA